MKNLELIKGRYLKDPLPRRLGAIAANLARIISFSKKGGNPAIVRSLLLESQYFIEWTAFEAESNLQARLVELQAKLAKWSSRLDQGAESIEEIAEELMPQAEELIQISGLAA